MQLSYLENTTEKKNRTVVAVREELAQLYSVVAGYLGAAAREA